MKKELKAKLNFIFISIYLIKVILFISSDLINLSARVQDEQSALRDLLDACNTLVVEKNEIGECSDAIDAYNKLISVCPKKKLRKSSTYTILLTNVASSYEAIGDNDQAFRLYKEVVQIDKRVLGNMHPDYATSLNNLAFCYSEMGDYEEAIKLSKKALFIREKCLGNTSPDYAASLSNLAVCYSEIGDYEEAIKLNKKALSIREKCLGNAHPDYAASLSNLAVCYGEIGDYEEAIKLHKEALSIREKCLGNAHPDYATSLNNLAYCYIGRGDYEEAIKLHKEALSIREKCLGNAHPDYAISLDNLADCHKNMGNYEEAIKLYKEVLSIREKCLGNTHPDYAASLNKLASCYSIMGDYEEAIRLHKEALSIQKRCLGNTHLDYANSLSRLADCYYQIGPYDEAIKLYIEALSIREKYLENIHSANALFFNDMALDYYYIDDYEKAIKFFKEALRIEEKCLGKKHSDYATSLNNLAACHSAMDNYKEAIKLYTEALDIIEKSYGRMHPNYIISLESLASCYDECDSDNLSQISLQLHNVKSNYLKRHFAEITSSARLLFWNNEKYYFKETIYKRSYLYKSQNLIEASYNSALISKGVILDTEIEFSKLVAECKDDEIFNVYKKLQSIRTLLNKQYERPIKEREVDTDSLELVTEELESKLIERSKEYGDYTKNLSIDWKQVKNALDKDEIAIEFVSFPISFDCLMYCALTLKNGYDTPRMIPLFEADELNVINPKEYYTGISLANLIWKPLEEELKDVTNIYFAPDGELYNIAIESLPHYGENGYVFESWNLHRLSSTRELAKTSPQIFPPKAVLYGGLHYDADITSIEEPQLSVENLYALHYRSEPDSLGLRGKFGELKGTLSEVRYIDSLYAALDVPSIRYTRNIGTETSLKRLDGRKVTNLHIATHGFYWTETELNHKKPHKLSFIGRAASPLYVEDKAMTRTGLLFAGANHAFTGNPIPEGYDDGVLTAKEISALDLHGLDLLVLSACQTGLGEIKGDGVYGLQRGFKMAGAQTIIMSLWKVDDDATQMLMTEFYKRYLSGQSKHEAFLAAQEMVRNFKGKIRNNDRDFSNPKYWAGFIMLDALN